MMSEEAQRRRLEAVQAAASDDDVQHDEGTKPYLDMMLTRRRQQSVAWLAALSVVCAEVGVVFFGSLGIVLYGVLTLVLLLGGGRVASHRLRTLLWSLAVVPTGRLVIFGAPLAGLPVEGRMSVVGVLTLLAALTAVRITGLSRVDIGWVAGWRDLPFALIMVVAGLALGIVERAAVVPWPFPDAGSLIPLLAVIGIGLVDDLLFQGLLLAAARRVVGRMAVPLIALLAAALHVGYGSWPLFACVAVTMAAFGWARTATGSLAVVVAGHIAFTLGVFIIGPRVAADLQALAASMLRLLPL